MDMAQQVSTKKPLTPRASRGNTGTMNSVQKQYHGHVTRKYSTDDLNNWEDQPEHVQQNKGVQRRSSSNPGVVRAGTYKGQTSGSMPALERKSSYRRPVMADVEQHGYSYDAPQRDHAAYEIADFVRNHGKGFAKFIAYGSLIVVGVIGLYGAGTFVINGVNRIINGPYPTDTQYAVLFDGDNYVNKSVVSCENKGSAIYCDVAPGGNFNKLQRYHLPLSVGNDNGVKPTITFKDVNGDGKTDIIVHLLNSDFTMQNTGTDFKSTDKSGFTKDSVKSLNSNS